MRICFLNRGRESMPGGDCIALDATMEALRRRGVECEETGWDRDRMRAGNFDLAHVFHCNFNWSYGNYEAVRDVGLPYVLTPIYYPGPLLSGITQKNLGEIFDGASYVIPFSKTELDNVNRDVSSLMEMTPRISIIPNATDEMFHSPFEEGSVDHAAEHRARRVMVVSARGETDKNIPLVKSICGKLGIDLTVASGWSRDGMADGYRHHRLFINASGSERMSLTIGEALCAGCRVLVTRDNWGNEWYPGLVTFDPADEIRLEHLIRWALTSPEWDYRPNAAARCLTWDWVAEKLEKVYKETLS